MSDFITNGELRIEAERLCDENDRLQAENAKLGKQGARLFDKVLELGTENANLRNLFYEAWNWMQRARYDGSIRDYEMDEIGMKAVALGFPDYELGIEIEDVG